MMSPLDDDALEALLRRPETEALDDETFTRAVMHRVRAEAAGPRETLDATAALALLTQRQRGDRRRRHWVVAGGLAGAALAAAGWWAGGGTHVVLAPPQSTALVLGLAATMWLVVAQALRELR